MARQIITGGNGTSGQTGEEVKDMINENFEELYNDLADTEEFDPDSKADVDNPTFTTRITTPLVKITGGSPGSGKVLTSDGDGDATWETPSSGSRASLRLTKFEFFTDCISAFISSGSAVTGSDEMAMIVSGTGTGSSVNTTGPVANRPGVVSISAGTTNSGYTGLFAGAGLKLAGGAWVYEAAVRVPTLSTSGERFVLKFGLTNSFTGLDELDAVTFIYDEGGVTAGSSASANWQLCTSNANTRTYTDSGVVVPANTWTKLRLEINAGGTSVTFYIDGSSVGTVATNLPASTRNLNIAAFIMKNVGTTARTVDIDYIFAELIFNSGR